MKRDMAELKKLVVDIIEHGGASENYDVNPQALQQLYRDVELAPASNAEPAFTIQRPAPIRPQTPENYNYSDQAEEIEESLSLVDKESELIKKALKKHKGKRKLAAEELGISERTLYRKIKELNLS